mmetsp:Transcript_46127/g.86031  ORF Transcript_46127/g.86031 Transcript_46127/m.86031 type:complete len:365 (-) Transcript_46127:137-1231(-)
MTASSEDRKAVHRPNPQGFGSAAGRGFFPDQRATSASGAGDTAVPRRVPVRRRAGSSTGRSGRDVTALSSEQSGADKIRARIQTCLQSRAGSGTCSRPLSRCRRAPKSATEVLGSSATSAGTTSRDDESQLTSQMTSQMTADGTCDASSGAWKAEAAQHRHRSPSRSTSAGLSNRAAPGPAVSAVSEAQPRPRAGAPQAYVPPKRAPPVAGVSASPGRPVEATAAAATGQAPSFIQTQGTSGAAEGSLQLLEVYRNIFEEIIIRDRAHGATLRKVKGVYDAYFLEVQRENARLRDFVATLQRALAGRGAASGQLRWTAPSPDRDLAAAWGPEVQASAATPAQPFTRPASVPRLDLRALAPTPVV